MRLEAENGTHVSEASGFTRTYSHSSAGYDQAFLYDQASDDFFRATPDFAVLRGKNYEFFNYADGFDRTYGFATLGNDTAVLEDGETDDYFRATPDFAVLRGKEYEFFNYATGFEQAYGYATLGNDLAILEDGATDDFFRGTPDFAVLRGMNQEFFSYATGFDQNYAYATGGDDRASLEAGEEEDFFRVTQDFSVRRGVRFEYLNYAHGFESLYSDGGEALAGVNLVDGSHDVDLFNVDRIADMVALANLEDGQRVATARYGSPNILGDGSAGEYIYRTTGRPTSDAGFFHNGAGTNDYFELADQSVVNVLQFGAAGDASTDDSAVIQAAIDVAESRAIALRLPDTGSSYLASGLVIESNGFVIEGDGTFEANDWPVLTLRASNVTVRGITFDGNEHGNSPDDDVLELKSGADGATITGCRFTNTATAIRASNADNGVISDCVFEDFIDRQVDIRNGSSGWTVTRNTANSDPSMNVALHTFNVESNGGISSGNVFTNNRVTSYGTPIQLTGSNDSLVVDTVIEGNIFINPGNSFENNGVKFDDVGTGNVLRNNEILSGGTGVFMAQTTQSILVEGNIITTAMFGGAHGIRVTSNSIIRSNEVYGSTLNGIHVNNNAINVTIENNLIADSSLDGISSEGTGTANHTIRFNTILRADDYFIDVRGDGCTITDNLFKDGLGSAVYGGYYAGDYGYFERNIFDGNDKNYIRFQGTTGNYVWVFDSSDIRNADESDTVEVGDKLTTPIIS